MKIIVLPFAGGHRYSFQFLKEYLSQSIQLEVIEYPGRGMRVKESLVNDIGTLAKEAVNSIQPLDSEYVVYGHSMGAFVAYHLCLEIEKLNLRYPKKLCVSGARAPCVPCKTKRFCLPHGQFWENIFQLGGTSKEFLQDERLVKYFESILRNDIEAFERYTGDKKLSIPITVSYGERDKIGLSDYNQWRNLTSSTTSFHPFKGNHFFIYDYGKELAELILSNR